MTSPKNPSKLLRIAAGLTVAGLLVAACGDGEESASAPGDTETSQDASDAEANEDLAEGQGEQEPPEAEETPEGDGDEAQSQEKSPAESTTSTDLGEISVTEVGVRVGADDAPFQLQIFADALCPFCAQLSQLMRESAQEWEAGDEVAVEHVTVTFLDDGTRETYSARAANILAAVADYDPKNWVVASDRIFDLQAAGGTDLTDAEILAELEAAGVAIDDDVTSAVEAMAYDGWNLENTEWARTEIELPHVPYVLFNGEPMTDFDSFEELIEQINDAVASD